MKVLGSGRVGDMNQRDRVQLITESLRREFPRLDHSAKPIAGRLVRLGTLFIEAIERVVVPFGLSANEYVILCVLRASGVPYALPPRRINPLMSLTSGGMTNILHALALRGLIQRLPDPSDRRGVLIRMTPAAVKLIDEAIAAHGAEEQRMIASLASKERLELQKLLSKLLLSLDPVSVPAPPMLAIHPASRSSAGRKHADRKSTNAATNRATRRIS
jgi:DNA-binding MarR family transcriptional regulator